MWCGGVRPVGGTDVTARRALRSIPVEKQRTAVSAVKSEGSPILDHQIELVDETIDFFEIFATALLGFDIEGAAKGDHVAQVTNSVL